MSDQKRKTPEYNEKTQKPSPEGVPEKDRGDVQDKTRQDLEREKMKHEVLTTLQHAKGSEARVRVFATLMDTYGVDALVSLIPEFGDAASSVLSGLYLLYEAQRAGLKKSAYLKIIGLQAADVFVGAIPVIGDVADYFFQANKWSARLFVQKTEELVAEARAAGVPEEEIAKITGPAERLPQLVDHAMKLFPPKTKEPQRYAA
jgi:molybdopterin converting factor small subunit